MTRLAYYVRQANLLRLLFILALLVAAAGARPQRLSAASPKTHAPASTISGVPADEGSASSGQATPQAAGDEQWADVFGQLGTSEPVTASTSAPDGTLYVIVRDRYIFHWDGGRWAQIGDVGDIGSIKALALGGERLYVAGEFTQFGGAPIRYLASWDGAAWTQVGEGAGPEILDGIGQPGLRALAVVGNTLYVGGRFDRIDGVNASSIAAWNGTGWSALGSGVKKRLIFGTGQALISAGIVEAIVPAEGRLYVGGDFKLAGGLEASSIAVWGGGAWSALGTGIALEQSRESANEWATVYAIAVSGTTVYAGGKFTRAGGKFINNIAAWNGAAWNALGGGISNDILDQVNVLLLDGATLYVAGRFRVVGATHANFARWTGTAWQAGGQLAGDANLEVQALSAAPGGFYIGGNFNTIDGVLSANIARRVGDGWRSLGQGIFSTNDRCCAGEVYATETDGQGHVYVGGRFKYAGGQPANNIAMWDGERWHALGAGVGDVPSSPVRDLLLVGDDLYVAGDFTSAGGAAISFIARYNTITGEWSRLGGGVSGVGVYTLAFVDGTLYVGGDFDSAGGVETDDVAAWDGAQWSGLSEKLAIREVGDECRELGTQVYTLEASGRYLVIGGHFRLVQTGFANPCLVSSYTQANNILLWDRIADEWFFLGPRGAYGVSGGGVLFPSVSALAVVGRPLDLGGTLYVGGEFNRAGPVNSPNLARFTTAGGWSALSGAAGGTGVYALEAAGSELFVGGSFTSVGGAGANNIARYDTVGEGWSALGSGVSASGGSDRAVYDLELTPDGVYVGGDFTEAGGVSALSFSRWAAPSTSQVVGPGGGTLNGERATVQVPAGAVAGDTTLRFGTRLVPVASAPEGQVIVRGFALDAVDEAGQPVVQLAQPASISIAYSDTELAALGVADPSKLNIVIWDGARWVPLLPCVGCGVDTARKTVTAVTNRLTEFALVGEASGNGGAGRTRLFLPLVRR